jgi:glycine/serine hydroxymethyltransferase
VANAGDAQPAPPKSKLDAQGGKQMNKELISAALHAADSLLGVAIHSGAHLQTAEGREDAKQVRELVKEALALVKADAQEK